MATVIKHTDPLHAHRRGKASSIAAVIALVWFFVIILSLIATQVPRAEEAVPHDALSGYFNEEPMSAEGGQSRSATARRVAPSYCPNCR